MKKIEFIDWGDIKMKNDYKKIIIDWDNVKNKKDLFNEFKRYITFPDYFWENWDAFWDIITDKYFVNYNIQIHINNYNKLFLRKEDKKDFLLILINWLDCNYCNYDIEIYIIKN